MIAKTALVTGATSGIGNAIANKLKQSGVNVIGVSMTEEDKNKFDGECIVIDLTNEQQIKEELAKIKKPDILINCAGFCLLNKSIEDTTTNDWDYTFDCNLKSMFLLVREVVPSMKENKYGVIVNMSSIYHKGESFQSPYSASKSAVVGFTRALAMEYAETGITINTVVPGLIDTVRGASAGSSLVHPSHSNPPIGRKGYPIEVATMITNLCGPHSNFITGQTIHVNGGSYYP